MRRYVIEVLDGMARAWACAAWLQYVTRAPWPNHMNEKGAFCQDFDAHMQLADRVYQAALTRCRDNYIV